MSDGVIVVEAKKKSGTMITVNFALEQGKDILLFQEILQMLIQKVQMNL